MDNNLQISEGDKAYVFLESAVSVNIRELERAVERQFSWVGDGGEIKLFDQDFSFFRSDEQTRGKCRFCEFILG